MHIVVKILGLSSTRLYQACNVHYHLSQVQYVLAKLKHNDGDTQFRVNCHVLLNKMGGVGGYILHVYLFIHVIIQ